MGIDARALGQGEDTGIARYIHALIEALREGHGVSTVLYRQEFPRVFGPQLALGMRMRLGGAAVIHGPANALPLARYRLPGVVTVHDLAIYDHPEWFPGGQWFATRLVVPHSIRSARLVICPSQATAAAISRLMGVGSERTRVIAHGVEPEFALPVAAETCAQTRSRYALPESYILQVGTVQPRKNYLATLRALARIPAGERVPLLIAGGLGWDYEPVIRAVERLGLRSWVRFLGYVGFRELPPLYQLARAVAFPSYDEGFGLPILEAFAAGAPVAASTAGAIPEVAGDAALLCAPDDEAALAQNLLRLISDEPFRQRQIAAGRVRAARYTWSACAAAHAQAYREAAAT